MAQNRCRAEISLPAIRENMARVRTLADDAQVMAVLKADAYGHGARAILPACEAGADWYAVAHWQEGAALRGDTQKPILVFGQVLPQEVPAALEARLTLSVPSLAYAQMLDARAASAGAVADIHIELDTGLNRSGIPCQGAGRAGALAAVAQVHRLPHLRVTGTYTHFSCSESRLAADAAYTRGQADLFAAVCGALTGQGVDCGLRHCCSSAGLLRHPEWHMDMVRTGMLVYGQCMTEEERVAAGLVPAFHWRARIVEVRRVAAGQPVSYGRQYVPGSERLLATVAAGYADGYRRVYGGGAAVLICGRRAPVRGVVCMDYLLADVTDIPGVAAGQWATLLGRDGDAVLPANELATFGSVSGEVTCAVSARMPRLYIPLD